MRQRRLGLWSWIRGVAGLLPPERNPNLAQLLGLGLGLREFCCCCCCVSANMASLSRGMDVQKALLQPVPILLSPPISVSCEFLSKLFSPALCISSSTLLSFRHLTIFTSYRYLQKRSCIATKKALPSTLSLSNSIHGGEGFDGWDEYLC